MNRYRITSDGIRWRIERFCLTWFRKRPKWAWIGRYHPDGEFTQTDFASLEEAEKAVRDIKQEDVAKARGYQVVKEPL